MRSYTTGLNATTVPKEPSEEMKKRMRQMDEALLKSMKEGSWGRNSEKITR